MDERKNPRDQLLERVLAYAAGHGIAGRSLREIAAGVGTSHRMLLYHFGSHEGLMAAIVVAMESGQRAAMAGLAEQAADHGADAMRAQWEQLASPELRPFVRLFFEVFGLAIQGTPGATDMLEDLTDPWIREGLATAARWGYEMDAAAVRLGVAVARGLLVDLLAGADADEVAAAHALFVQMMEARRIEPT
jgi:AcrR family transcriptional regulator